MEYLIIIIFLIIILIILKRLFGYNKKEIEKIAKNKELDEIAKKYPDNLEMCKEYLKMLKNEEVVVEEDKKATSSLYIAISNKIVIADVKDSFTRIQTIAHECLHSIQNRNILLFNFVYSNIYIIYFIVISLLAILKILPYKMMFLSILIIGGLVYYFVRSYLENDAMIKARFLSKEYMEKKNISSQQEIDDVIDSFDKLNNIGIKSVNYVLLLSLIIEFIIFCVICMIK
mgnify:CR=1 FL=1